ncbi:hypothetical protein XENOCAPTIV_003318, partial [Xenoophorus captivus]
QHDDANEALTESLIQTIFEQCHSGVDLGCLRLHISPASPYSLTPSLISCPLSSNCMSSVGIHSYMCLSLVSACHAERKYTLGLFNDACCHGNSLLLYGELGEKMMGAAAGLGERVGGVTGFTVSV